MRNYGTIQESQDGILKMTNPVMLNKRSLITGFEKQLRKNEDTLKNLRKQKVFSEYDTKNLEETEENIKRLVGTINEQMLFINKPIVKGSEISVVVSELLSVKENYEIIEREYTMNPKTAGLLRDSNYKKLLKTAVKQAKENIRLGVGNQINANVK